jgi:hypothetical protein
VLIDEGRQLENPSALAVLSTSHVASKRAALLAAEANKLVGLAPLPNSPVLVAATDDKA